MITKYIQAALDQAQYEMLPEDGGFYGEIPACRGVFAQAPTLEDCRRELTEVLEDWIFLRTHRHLPLPALGGIELSVRKTA